MPVTVEAEGLGTIEFPDGTTDEEILGALPKLHEQVQRHDRIQNDLRGQMALEQRNQAPGQMVEAGLTGAEDTLGAIGTTLRRIPTAIPRAAHAVGSLVGLNKQPYVDTFEPNPELATPTQMGVAPDARPLLNSDIITPAPQQNEWGRALTGLAKSGVDTAGGIIADPAMLMALPAAGGNAGAAALQSVIGGQMVGHLPESSESAGTQLENVRQAILRGENPDTTPFWKSAGDLATTAAFAGGPLARGAASAVPKVDPIEQKIRSVIRDEIKNAVQEVVQPKTGEVPIPENTPRTPEPKTYEPNLLPENAPVAEAPKPAPTPRPGDRMVTIQKPDGSTYEAAFGDKYWEGFPGNPAQIAKPVEGGWSHGILPEGDKIIERAKEVPNENQGQETVKPSPEVHEVNPKAETTAGSEVVGEASKGLEKPAKWTSATADEPTGGMQVKVNPRAGEAGAIDVTRIIKDVYDWAEPSVKRGIKAIKDLKDETLKLPPTSDIRRSILNWSSRHQQSFDEAAQAQKEITKTVPNQTRREGITNWIQAGGDKTILAERAKNSSDPKLKAGYEAALNLTPEELAVANDVKAAFDALGKRGQANEVLSKFRDNYAPQIWDLKKGPTLGGSRTLRENFKFSKARTFESFFEGEQAGFVPKTKDIAKLLPVYLHEMNSVIAARKLVAEMSKGKASDGLPLIRTRGRGVQVEGDTGGATLVLPDASKASDVRYQTLDNQPALHGWKWVTKDDVSGKDMMMKGDLELHPEAYARLKNALGQSAIKEWYRSPGSLASSIPKALVKGLDNFQSETKRTMLGLIAPFHQVQEGTHAVGHRINPFFGIPKIDLVGNKAQVDATKHGLMLAPDRSSANQFMEGLRTSGLVSRIPIIGKVADHYSDYLFHQYIPGLKFKTYEAIVERNTKVYENELASGAVKPEDIKILSAEQANAAYGHLNYSDLGRNPTIQHVMQLGLLAPDFFEARARFAGQAIKGASGAKIGREQMIALATLALAQAVTAWTSAQLTGGEWDEKHPFEFHVGDRRYTMRSVPEDIAGLATDPRKFVYSRLSPTVGKGSVQLISGVDWAGRPISPGKTLQQTATQFVPLNIRGFEWMKDFMGESRPGSLSPLEQFAGSLGLRVSRYSAQSEVGQLARDYRKANNLPTGRFVTDEPTENSKLRNALLTKNDTLAKAAIEELRKTKKDSQIWQTFGDFKPYRATGSVKDEAAFKKSLTPEQQKLYNDAVKEREEERTYFKKLWAARPSK